ncbi:hypothetical protein JTB14_018562 [Gonioctena quinquepunctata]|nr:hypothetical protein JTB14_018562 [Gonioctena quinquepunctata]
MTLIPIGMVLRHNINTWDAGKYKLTSVTGHSLRTWGTAVISIDPEDRKWTAIVCDNGTLGNVRAILGRDFLYSSQACISYENGPFVTMRGKNPDLCAKKDLLVIVATMARILDIPQLR